MKMLQQRKVILDMTSSSLRETSICYTSIDGLEPGVVGGSFSCSAPRKGLDAKRETREDTSCMDDVL